MGIIENKLKANNDPFNSCFLSEKKFSVNRNRVYIRNRFAERYANNSILVTEKTPFRCYS